MPDEKTKPELLAPAGNFEKLEIAIHYGADAVYLAGKDFSLRNLSGNFSDTELIHAVKLAHQKNVKVYLACNIYSRNHEQDQLRDFLKKAADIRPDALIISDPGIIQTAREIDPQIDIHLSTQANTTNYNAARFWGSMGVKRINLARELSLTEIKEIAALTGIETEAFIHGAMCISYSGRCLLSTFLTHRDSNRGLCSHPCRWKYSVVEEMRPNDFLPVTEDNRGTYIFNSKDLCMIHHIPELVESGLCSFKIEGRMKGIHYLGTIVKAYREAIDAYCSAPEIYTFKPRWAEEISKVYHRDYSTGFYFDTPDDRSPNYENRHLGRIHCFVGKILEQLNAHRFLVGVRNKILATDRIEVVPSQGPARESAILEMTTPGGEPVQVAQPNTQMVVRLAHTALPNDIIRKI